MRRNIQIAALLIAFTASLYAQQLTRTSLAGTNIVAHVNGTPLFQKDLDAHEQALFPFYSVHGGQVPANAKPEIHQKAMDRLLLEELLYQDAHRRGFTATAAEIDARVLKARKKAGSSQAFSSAITETYGSMKNFRERIERAILIERVWNAQVTRPARASEADLLAYYRANKKNFERPEAVQLQTISFVFAENATAAQQDQARKRAEAILSKAQATKTVDEFGAIAEKSSEDDWRVMNGDHGWVHRGTVDQELESAFQMKPGQVSEIVRSRVGFHILRVNGYRAAQQLTFAQVKKDIRMSLEKQRQEKLRTAFEEQLKQKARIEYPRG